MERYTVLFGRHRFSLANFVIVFTGICLFGIIRVRFVNNPEQSPGGFNIERKSP